MKVYGFDDSDVVRGELQAANGDRDDLYFSEAFMCSLGWEYISTRFADAQKALLERMEAEGSDPELIETVRGFKASFITAN